MAWDGDVVIVAGRERARWFEHQDGSAGRRRLVFHSSRHDEGVALTQRDGRLIAGGAAQFDVEGAVEDEEELVGVVVGVPHVLSPGVRDSHVVVIDGGDDPGAPHIIERDQCLVQVHRPGRCHDLSLAGVAKAVLYVVEVVETLPDTCQVKAWRPPGIDEISEVFHARIVDYGYPPHCHNTWTVLIVDDGAISYDLDRRRCGAFGETVAILPPGVTHNGKPATGARGFTKRVLYLDEAAIPAELVGAAVDRTSIDDPVLRRVLAELHEELVLGADPFTASSALALIVERIGRRLDLRPGRVHGAEEGIAKQLRLILDEAVTAPISLDDAALQLGRSKAHLVRSFSGRYGVAPHAYLIGKRVEAARRLLLQGVPAAEVATAVGFYDQSHLTRHFKRHTAVPPAAYANSHPRPAPAPA